MTALKSDYRMALETGAQALEAALSGLDAKGALARAAQIYVGELCVVSSFGAESAAILHMIGQAAPNTPVLFLDTHKLFEETLDYRDALVERLGLTDVRTVIPPSGHLQADDPDGDLHARNPDMCCHIRKTLPLIKALSTFKVWISGRKRHHGGGRAALPRVEIQDGKLKLNPLYDWSPERIDAYYEKYDLPRHPLVARGYRSIGCLPCTAPVAAGDDPRAGRWAGQDKTECGIHFTPNGVLKRGID
jgi:phosphoadenosine phosphosulfate reductase